MSFRRLLLFLNFLLVYVPQLLSTLENAYGVIVSLCIDATSKGKGIQRGSRV